MLIETQAEFGLRASQKQSKGGGYFLIFFFLLFWRLWGRTTPGVSGWKSAEVNWTVTTYIHFGNMICNTRQSWVHHVSGFLVLPISVTLLHDSVHRLLNPVPSRALEAVADKTVGHMGKNKVRVPQAPLRWAQHQQATGII